jgi:hypothetical protein
VKNILIFQFLLIYRNFSLINSTFSDSNRISIFSNRTITSSIEKSYVVTTNGRLVYLIHYSHSNFSQFISSVVSLLINNDKIFIYRQGNLIFSLKNCKYIRLRSFDIVLSFDRLDILKVLHNHHLFLVCSCFI